MLTIDTFENVIRNSGCNFRKSLGAHARLDKKASHTSEEFVARVFTFIIYTSHSYEHVVILIIKRYND